MNYLEYIFKDKSVIHALITKPSVNSKIGLGYVMMTYHFSVDQIEKLDLSLDTNNGGMSG